MPVIWMKPNSDLSTALPPSRRIDDTSGSRTESFDTVLDLPVPPADYVPVSSFRALQEWEGYVIEIGTDDFVARLLDITADSSSEEEVATIPLEEVSERDKNRMELGSIFRWVIGYEHSITGSKRRVSEIVFLDLPRITDADIREGKAWAKRVISVLGL